MSSITNRNILFHFVLAAGLLLALAGCGAPAEEPTAALSTAAPLATVATTAKPTAEPSPTATTTPEPSPTSSPTAEPSPTELLATSLPAAETAPAVTPAGPAGTGSLAEETVAVLDATVTLPEGAVIYFSQEGGFAGVMYSWIVYEDGTIVNSAGQITRVPPEDVAAALEAIEQSGFYDLNQPKPSDVCCDFFHYTLVARDGSRFNAVSLSEGDPNMPVVFSESVAVMLALIQNSYPSQ
jgi:hypothetical protein